MNLPRYRSQGVQRRLPVSFSVALVLIGLCSGWASSANAAPGDCGQPASTGADPTATDALVVLRTAVGSESCVVCVCDVDSSGTTTASDALLVLKSAVGSPVSLTCVACVSSTLYAVATHPAGDGTLYRIENYATAPTAVVIGGGNLSLVGDIAVDPTTGEGYGVLTTGSLVGIDLNTGSLISSVAGAGVNPNALTFSDDGTLYSWGGRPQNPGMDTNLYVLDKQNGGGQAVLDTGFVAAGDLTFDAESGFLYGSATTGDIIRIDLAAMSATSVGVVSGIGFGMGLLGLDIDPNDGTMYALASGTFSNTATLYTVDKSSAQLTLVGNIDGAHNLLGGWGLAFAPPAE